MFDLPEVDYNNLSIAASPWCDDNFTEFHWSVLPSCKLFHQFSLQWFDPFWSYIFYTSAMRT